LVLQDEQEYEMSVKLFDDVDYNKSRWEILSTKVRTSHVDVRDGLTGHRMYVTMWVKRSAIFSHLGDAIPVTLAWFAQIEIRLYKVRSSVFWPTLEASNTLPAAH
jgi:hypothetical protein